VFLGLSGRARIALSGDHHGSHAEVVQGLVDLVFAVAAVDGSVLRAADVRLAPERARVFVEATLYVTCSARWARVR
jgi:hypothetical protein